MHKTALAAAAILLIGIGFTMPAQAQMYGDNPYDRGCNVNVGGNCGKQLDMWNNTWRRLGYPLEPGRGSHGTYPPGGGYIPQSQYRDYGNRGFEPRRRLVPIGPPVVHRGGDGDGLMCRRTYADGRVEWYRGRCRG